MWQNGRGRWVPTSQAVYLEFGYLSWLRAIENHSLSGCYLNYRKSYVQFFFYCFAECLFVTRKRTCTELNYIQFPEGNTKQDSLHFCLSFVRRNRLCWVTRVGEVKKEKTGSWCWLLCVDLFLLIIRYKKEEFTMFE